MHSIIEVMSFLKLLLLSKIAFSAEILEIHQSITLKWNTCGSVHNSNAKIIKVRATENHIIITGSKLGTATLRCNNLQKTIHVLPLGTRKNIMNLDSYLNNIRGLNWKVKDNGIIEISGRLLKIRDWINIINILQDVHFIFSARIPKGLQSPILENLQHRFKNSDIKPIFEFSPKLRALIHPDIKNKSELMNQVKKLGMTIIESQAILHPSKQVVINLHILEISHNRINKLGLSWPTTISGKIVSQNIQFHPLEISLTDFLSNTKGKTIANPKLVCRNGKTAEFLAGGEIPLQIINYGTRNISWKKFGVLLKFKPEIHKKLIRLWVDTEISSPDYGNAIKGIPAFKTNRVSSYFDLFSKETLFLTGLFREVQGKSKTGFSLLSSLPILGEIFKSHEFQRNKSELVITVTPSLLRTTK